MRLNVCLTFCVALLTPITGASAESLHKCVPLMFASTGMVTVHEHVPAFLPLCYAFSTTAGQNMSVNVTKEDDVNFSIVYDRPGDNLTMAVADGEQSFHFVTESRVYRILVSSRQIHANTEDYFTLVATLK